jgi:predicted PurR-regulated permease PerM
VTQNSPDHRTRAERAGRRSLWVLTLLATFTILHVASALFIPIALALYFAIVLSPPVELLCRARLPRPLAAAAVMLLLVGALGLAVDQATPPAREWLDRAPSLLLEVERKIRPLRNVAVKLDKVSERAERVAAGPTGEAGAPAITTSRRLLRAGPALLLSIGAVLFLTFFMLVSGPQTLVKVALRGRHNLTVRQIVSIIEHARRETARYLGTLTLINLGLGAATALLAMAFGLPTPLLWGALAAVMNYIPYAGSAVTLLVLTVVSILTHDELGPVIGVAGGYLLLTTIEGQLVQPLAVGRRLALSPLMVFLALWFWGWLWGVAGMLLATPMLLTVKAVSVRVPAWRPFADLLSPAHPLPVMARARAWRRYKARTRALRECPATG